MYKPVLLQQKNLHRKGMALLKQREACLQVQNKHITFKQCHISLNPRQAHSPQHTPLGDPRPSFMFKDYQLIQNVPETQQQKKKKKAGAGQESEGGSCGDTGCLDFIYLLAFILIRWNNTPLFWGGICKCFRAIKREMKVSMDSMREY